MNLIGPLISGVSAAANGTVEFLVRGTSVHPTVYGDFYGASVLPSSSGRYDLNSSGGGAFYVPGIVDVVVRDTDDSIVISFTCGVNADDVEVQSASFTGVDYLTLATGVSKPTTLAAVLAKWIASSGEPDWYLDLGGTTTALSDLPERVVVNVKDSGAVGDNVADDRPAIQTAIGLATAGSPNSILVFPPGTYRLGGALLVSGGLTFVGAGMEQTVLTTDHGTARSMTVSAGTGDLRIHGMSIKASQANSGVRIYGTVGSSYRLMLSEVYLGGVNCTGALVGLTAGQLCVSDSKLVLGTAAGQQMYDGVIHARNSTLSGVYGSAGAIAQLQCSGGASSFVGCTFDMSLITGNDAGFIALATTASGTRIIGCHFISANYAAPFPFIWLPRPDQLQSFCEVGNTVAPSGGNLSQLLSIAAGATTPGVSFTPWFLGSRHGRAFNSSLGGGGATISLDGYASYAHEAYISIGVAGATTVDMGRRLPYGTQVSILMYNGSGGASGNIVITGNSYTLCTTGALADTKYRRFLVEAGGSYGWHVVDVSADFGA